MLLGRVPAERHVHHDADGKVTGWTVVEREPLWLDSDWSGLEALAEHDRGVCHGCGWHKSLTEDRRHRFGFEYEVCPVCKGRDQHDRALAEADERFEKSLGERPPPLRPRPKDGRTTLIRLQPPEEGATT